MRWRWCCIVDVTSFTIYTLLCSGVLTGPDNTFPFVSQTCSPATTNTTPPRKSISLTISRLPFQFRIMTINSRHFGTNKSGLPTVVSSFSFETTQSQSYVIDIQSKEPFTRVMTLMGVCGEFDGWQVTGSTCQGHIPKTFCPRQNSGRRCSIYWSTPSA